MDEQEKRFNYIKTILIPTILKQNDNLRNSELLKCTINLTETLNGFMSNIYTVELLIRCNNTQSDTVHQMIVKLMKPGNEFRAITKSEIQFANEIYIYTNVLPYYKKSLQQINASPGGGASSLTKFIKIENWIPHVYFGYYGKISEISDLNESVLAIENLTPKGYRNGPRLYLDEQHLLLMTKYIAELHSMTYALRIKKDSNLINLIDNMIPLPFLCGDGERNLYKSLYDVGFRRFFEYYDKIKLTKCTEQQQVDVNNLRKKYEHNPLLLLEQFLRIDDTFSVILHGDYNRNNVLFKYESETGYDNPVDVKMIDFQESRYGTPAIDLSFFMYMNMDPTIREHFWDNLLKYYHDNIIRCLMEILNCEKDDDRLKPYRYDKFIEHFSQFAFYGCMICIHFIPWMTCSVDECTKLTKFFEADMFGDEFMDISMIAGGDATNEIIINVIKHASAKGYMKMFE